MNNKTKKALSSILLMIFVACERTYVVQKVKSHYPNKDDNDLAHLIVYEPGDKGFIKEVMCEFPPDSDLVGLSKVRVGKEARNWIFEGQSYYCKAVAFDQGQRARHMQHVNEIGGLLKELDDLRKQKKNTNNSQLSDTQQSVSGQGAKK